MRYHDFYKRKTFEERVKISLKDKWIIQVFIISFILSAIFSGLSSLLSDINVIALVVIILIVIGIGILFDMIGVAALTAEEAPFHAMNSKKIKEATACINLLKNNTKVSSICNDIVGDICGIVRRRVRRNFNSVLNNSMSYARTTG